MNICGGCGAIATTNKDECSRCGTEYADGHHIISPPVDDVQMVRLFGYFECRSCGSQVALNYFTLDGYLCGSCGVHQRFDWDQWEQIVEHAHNTVDLTGFNHPGLDKEAFWTVFEDQQGEDVARMFRSIGRSKTTLSKGNSYMTGVEFELDVTPGHPLCGQCKAPMDVHIVDDGLSVSCDACDIHNVYRPPADTPYESLLAPIAPEHELNTHPIQMGTASGGAALAIRCPNCKGNLDVDALGSVVKCPFCNTSVCVPARVIKQVGGKALAKNAWWMAFTGTSKWRSEAEEKVSLEETKMKARRESQQRKREYEAEQAILQDEKQKKLNRIIMIGLGLLLTAIIFFVTFF